MIATRSRPAVFLDRDGVLNEAFVRDGVPTPPRSLEEFRVLPGVAEACAELRRAGFVLVVVTNQPDVARGTQTRGEVDRMHERLRSLVPLDEVQKDVAHRAARLYRFDHKKYQRLQKRGFNFEI